MKRLVLDGTSLTLDTAVPAAEQGAKIAIDPACRPAVGKARRIIEAAVREKKPLYGVTTGFGALSNVLINRRDSRRLQLNLILSHAAGVGEPLPESVVRLAVILMLNGKARGNSGLRWSVLGKLASMVNRGVIPRVPEKGSVGASGDLAPLAHLTLVLLGRGTARFKGEWIDGASALRQAGLKPLELAEGEGVGLINGTQVMTAIGARAVWHARRLAKLADIAAAMSLEVLLGTNTQFHKRIHNARPHRGQGDSAANMRKITDHSEIISSHKDCNRIQDAYSLRCVPQVHGASRDAIAHAVHALETEMNSSTENPLVFPDGRVLSGGNFHGQPIALAMDFLGIALAELANISERRIERMVNPALSGLPSFLIEEGGLNSGFMIAQYTAAALVSENKVLAHPASVDSIPTSAGKEDHVSMGTIAARKAWEILQNARRVIGIELLCAAQALDLFTNLRPGKGALAAYRTIRKRVVHMDRDRELHRDMETVFALMDDGSILDAVEKAAGALH